MVIQYILAIVSNNLNQPSDGSAETPRVLYPALYAPEAIIMTAHLLVRDGMRDTAAGVRPEVSVKECVRVLFRRKEG